MLSPNTNLSTGTIKYAGSLYNQPMENGFVLWNVVPFFFGIISIT